MIPPIQLLSTDFDGTVFAEFEQPPVPLNLQNLIQRLQTLGTRWVINTGRDMSALMECLGRAHLTVKPDYLVLVEREVYRHEGTRYVGLDEWNQRCREDHDALFQRLRPDLPDLIRWINHHFDATLYEDSFSPLCLIAENNNDADRIVHYLDAYCRTLPELSVVRNDVYARFSHAAYNKGTALAEIQRLLNIAPDATLAAGDHFNDLPMLAHKHAAYLVAPANAIPSVKQTVRNQGGYVSRAEHGQGVWDGLRHYLAPMDFERPAYEQPNTTPPLHKVN
jgi:HAD superfamily hydrolase (TIGR01484 family)